MTTTAAIRAAELLEREAASLRECCTVGPDHVWTGSADETDAKRDHDEFLAVAAGLRAAPMQPLAGGRFYLLSLKHTGRDEALFTWWGPDSRGYTWDLNRAGTYDEAEARRIEQGGDTHDTVAVPVDLVLAAGWLTVERGPCSMKKMGVLPQWEARWKAIAERERVARNAHRRQRRLEIRGERGQFLSNRELELKGDYAG